mmetsp:Transcript_32097/g.43819  ORF Transcript_32097/g.43819 Transcript_32097/m.43819 type:complete len:459 (+) Transcript_32097:347-1723(+)
MITIPSHLMISPPVIFNDPDIGEILRKCYDIIEGDLLLVLYMMREMNKKEKSFFYPFLQILPEPSNISVWMDDQLKMFQDPTLVLRAKNRRQYQKLMYHRSVVALHHRYPNIFPLEEYTLKAFAFCLNSVQARAFGRRLPWSAMVPFADCLNHGNVQTKYDYNVEGNNKFRLFPSGKNHYRMGSEVFNSYGRRPNENLLQDYGFAMLDNEWEEVDLHFEIPEGDLNYSWKRRALFAMGHSTRRLFRMNTCGLSFEMLSCLRVAVLHEDEIEVMEDNEFNPERIQMDKFSQVSPISMFHRIVGRENELRALRTMFTCLNELVESWPTSLENDELLLIDLLHLRPNKSSSEKGTEITRIVQRLGFDYDSDEYWKLLNAVKYRLTRKRIITKGIHMVNTLISWFEDQPSSSGQQSKCKLTVQDVFDDNNPALNMKRSLIYKVQLHEYLDMAASPTLWVLPS